MGTPACTLGSCGCAVTSAVMILNYYGVHAVTITFDDYFSNDANPKDLNKWLKENNGYLGDDLVWTSLENYSDAEEREIDFVEEELYDWPGGIDVTEVKIVRDEINAKHPVIVKVTGPHWVVITGIEEDTYHINDPYWRERTTLASYNNRIYALRVYYGILPVPLEGEIVFHSNRDDNFEIYSMNADGTNQTRLTTNPGNDQYAVWSPSGRIAFASEQDGNQEIYSMNADGTNQTRLTYNKASDWVPDWSPDSKKMVFTSDRDGNSEIYIMNDDGSNQMRLTVNAADDRDPVFSTDGNKIAFESNRDGNPEIYIMKVDGTEVERLTYNGALDRHPDWLSDCSKIVFASNRDGNDEIYVMDADGGNQIRLTHNNASDLDPTGSPDGENIAFASNRDGDYEIYVMNVDGSNQVRLTANEGEDYRPDWTRLDNLSPVSGKGIWIWKIYDTNVDGKIDYGNLDQVVEKLESCGVRWVTVKFGDGSDFWPTNPDHELYKWLKGSGYEVSDVVIAFKKVGIRVLGWQYVYGDLPVEEASVANRILDVGVDGLIINAETEYKGKPDEAVVYMKGIRREHPESFIAYAPFPIIDYHKDFPYIEFGKYSDAVMPQAYWKEIGRTPEEMIDWMEAQWCKWHKIWEEGGYGDSIKPVIPLGQGWAVSGSEIVRFCNLVYYHGYYGVSLWRYGTMTEENWQAYTECFPPTLTVSIYTDKTRYHLGEDMHLGLDVANRDPAISTESASVKHLCFAIWVELPDSSIYLHIHEHSVVLPDGLNYTNPDFQTITLPSLLTGNYTWHAAFLERATHTIIVEDTAEWIFS